jgi:hypothetical protein
MLGHPHIDYYSHLLLVGKAKEDYEILWETAKKYQLYI